MVPDEPPVPLGLEQAELVVGLTPQGAGQTRVQAQLDLHTRMMGFLQANLETPFYFSPEQGFEIRESDLKTINRSEEHTSELQSRGHLVCRLLLEKKRK